MKKKHRTIVVDGVSFQWTASWSYSNSLRMVHLRVWGGQKTKCCLQVQLHNKWLSPYSDSSYPMPKDVRTIILFGIAQGWDPNANGEAFWLVETQNDLQLDNLIITDYGRVPEAQHPFARMHRSAIRESPDVASAP